MDSELLNKLQMAAGPLMDLLKQHPELHMQHKVHVTDTTIELTESVCFDPCVGVDMGRTATQVNEEKECQLTFDHWFHANKQELVEQITEQEPALQLLRKVIPLSVLEDAVKQQILDGAKHLSSLPKPLQQVTPGCDCMVCKAMEVAIKHIKSST